MYLGATSKIYARIQSNSWLTKDNRITLLRTNNTHQIFPNLVSFGTQMFHLKPPALFALLKFDWVVDLVDGEASNTTPHSLRETETVLNWMSMDQWRKTALYRWVWVWATSSLGYGRRRAWIVWRKSVNPCSQYLRKHPSRTIDGPTSQKLNAESAYDRRGRLAFKTKADMEQVRLMQATKQWLDIGSEELSMEMQVEEFKLLERLPKENKPIGLAAKLEYDRKRDAKPEHKSTKRKQLYQPLKPRLFYNNAKTNWLNRRACRCAKPQESRTSTCLINSLAEPWSWNCSFQTRYSLQSNGRGYQMENLGLAQQAELDTIANGQTVSDIKQTHQQTQAKTRRHTI